MYQRFLNTLLEYALLAVEHNLCLVAQTNKVVCCVLNATLDFGDLLGLFIYVFQL